MKNLKLFSIVLLLGIQYHISAQEESTKKVFKNEIGIELPDLINGSVQITYERLLGKHISVGVGIGIKSDDGLLRISGINSDQISTSDIFYSGYKIIPEVRYYLNKTQQNSMDGFYFGGYLKLANYNSDLNGTYIDDDGERFKLAFDADLSITTVGFMIGYKLPVWKKFSIDFLIAGPGVGFHNYGITNTEDLPDSFYDDLNDALDEYGIFELIDGEFRFSSTNLSTDFLFPSFRYGFAVTYSF